MSNQDSQPVRLLSEKEIAERSGVSIATVRRNRDDGKGPPYVVVRDGLKKNHQVSSRRLQSAHC